MGGTPRRPLPGQLDPEGHLGSLRLRYRLALTVLDGLHPEGEGLQVRSQGPVSGELYRVASYNIGFGAYSNDYSFFMDGGKESRARSPEAVR